MRSTSTGASGSRPDAGTRSLLTAARYGIPELPSPHVRRSRLLSALARTELTSLTLVSAPAGTGKTTLVADWARRLVLHDPTAWVTFEDGDASLWPDLLTCLGRLGVAVPVLHRSSSGAVDLSRSQLTAVAEAIASAPRRLTVVLDGYELVQPDEARDLNFLLEHSFGRLGLVLLTRVDPVLPLYRYRLESSLTEVRVADLAFTEVEAAALLRGAGVHLDEDSLHAVNSRVRGWAAGLRFAARALADDGGRTAASTVTQNLDVNEYLLGEVLDVQRPAVRHFLLESSVADVLSPALVTELCGPEARRLLSGLGHLNTFAEPVPGQPGSFRYYPFFKELLQAQLAYERPGRWIELHATAAAWCEQEDLPDRALAHLAAIQAWSKAAALLVSSDRVGVLLSEGELAGPTWAAATRLPRDLATPEACTVRAAVALAQGDAHRCAQELAGARAAVAASASEGTDAAGGPDEAGGNGAPPAVLAAIAIVDAARATMVDGVERASFLAAEAQQVLTEARRSSPGVSSPELFALLRRCQGVAAIRRGDLRQARSFFEEALAPVSTSEAISPGVRADLLGHLALVDALEGHLARASRTAEASLALADGKRATAVCHGEAAAHIALGTTALQRCHPKDARHHASVAGASPALCGHPLCRALLEIVLAGSERAAGDLQPALARLDSAVDAAAATDPWLADLLRLETARLGLASGRTEVALTALDAMDERDDPGAVAVAAAAFAEQGEFAVVEDQLAHLRHRPVGLQSEVTALLAEGARDLHHHAPGRARAALDRSLRLAAPEGLRRPFREGGPLVHRLMSSEPGVMREHTWLQGHLGGARPTEPGHEAAAASRQHGPAAPVEDLTAKELEVLGHLEELLTTEEIAGRMFISVNTVRTHVRNILRKLDVNRRNAAVRRARELHLLDRDPQAQSGRADSVG